MKLIKLKTEKETVYINRDNIISYEVIENIQKIDTDREDGVFEDVIFFEISFITKHRIYKDNTLYADIEEIEKEYDLI